LLEAAGIMVEIGMLEKEALEDPGLFGGKDGRDVFGAMNPRAAIYSTTVV
jgi:hypothetical protein